MKPLIFLIALLTVMSSRAQYSKKPIQENPNTYIVGIVIDPRFPFELPKRISLTILDKYSNQVLFQNYVENGFAYYFKPNGTYNVLVSKTEDNFIRGSIKYTSKYSRPRF